MKKVIYCKYNLNRAPQFQTKTVIYQEGEIRYIEKFPLTENANSHITAFEGNYKLIKELYPKINFIICEKTEIGIRYPYIEGIPMDEVLKDRITQWEDVLPQLKKMIEEIYVVNPMYLCSFEMTEGFKNLFGDIDCKDDRCVCPCNLDVIFDNLMLVEDVITAFDYEWIFEFPVPEKYIIYRILCRFYDKYLHYMERHFSFDEYIAAFNFSEEEKVRYRKMEDAFIAYVYENGDPTHRNAAYKRSRINLTQIEVQSERTKILEKNYSKALEDYKKVEEVLHNTEKEYLVTIERLNEAARLKMDADQVILQQTDKINFQTEQISSQTEQINMLKNQYNNIINSKSSRIIKPLRLCIRGIRSIKNEGVIATLRKVKNKISNKHENEKLNEQQNWELLSIIEVSEGIQEMQKKEHFQNEYKVSIITPLFNTPQNFLVELLDSVKNQTYGNWEFCLVNFSTTDFDRVDQVCKEYAKVDSRISYHVADENRGISENTNTCISYATGEYIGLLDHDDVLHPCALYEVMKAINETGADFVYTDEVKFNESLKHVFLPNFKPDFSLDELRAHNYICHFNVYKTSLYHQVGGYRKEFDGSQDHDIVLRLTEIAEKIVHIPKILYYWRVHPNSVAQNISAKSYATDAGVAAVTEQLARMGEKQYVQSVVGNIPLYRIRTDIEESPDVTVVIWNGKDQNAVNKTIASIKAITDCEYIVLDDERNLGASANQVMQKIVTKFALFICAGLEVKSETFVKEFMIYASRNDIATIDCKILTEGNTIYSGGACMTGDEGMPIKLRCMGGPRDYAGYENGMYHTRNVTASTGLCTFVDVNIWKETDGFTETDSMSFMLQYSYNQWKRGNGNLWIPFIEACGLDLNIQEQYTSTLFTIRGEFDNRDAYVSEYVSQLHLE